MAYQYRRVSKGIVPTRTILIVTEGSKTEPSYFRTLKSRHRLLSVEVSIEASDGSDPHSILQSACNLREERHRVAKSNTRIAPYDEVWIVFDTEGAQHHRHQQIPSVLAKASQKNVNVAWSNPCFEFWLLLHVSDRQKPYSDCRAVNHDLKSVDNLPGYSKSMDMAPFMERVQIACERAAKCNDERHQGESYTNNPSTVVHRLVELLLANSRHQP